ncbi:hypothetical protein [Pseudanabaena mucicola]|uniref:DUF1269 domain-containing protein n=1 Tax=Pseudanabaena mucicola FACHB-723 TaxID=2692860 RepID=A0ABR8A177_9CYAN|nr:hypothetical protein [Pseudanabaena mucicola]MBD2189937.1 hypothetical protein [Pseudanabaena mucicola FACHB-723]
MSLKHKNAIGILPDRQSIESAIAQLRETEFPMSKISVVVEHINPTDTTIGGLTEPVVQSEREFARDRTQAQIGHGALDAGVLGSVVGGVVAGLSTLAFPAGGGAVLLVGMAAGAFYGTLSGGLLGGAIGAGISEEQAKHYSDLLAQGNYLVAIEGTDTEIDQAESVLKTKNIQDWITFEKF